VKYYVRKIATVQITNLIQHTWGGVEPSRWGGVINVC